MNLSDVWSWLMGPQSLFGSKFWIIAALIAVPVFVVREYRAGKRRDALIGNEAKLDQYRNLVSHDDEEDDD